MTTFDSFGLKPSLVTSLTSMGILEPTPIQQQAIPHVLAGRDVLGLAQTGTGKTAAFGLPMLHHLMAMPGKPAPKTVKALILAPTRELVNQIAENLRGFTRGTPIKVLSVVGGMSIHAQAKALALGADVLVATPGRLLDHVKRQAVRLDSAKFLVLDEADQMLDLGFIHALREISRLVGHPRQTLLFSATLPRQMNEIAASYLTDPVRVEVSPAGKAADKVEQFACFLEASGKLAQLKTLLAAEPDALSLVFTRTKHGAEKLMKTLVAAGFAAASIHGNKSQGQRDRALKAFRSGEIRVLVATDVAARGIDIPGVHCVYNYELPEVAENYVHRIGRTARAGASGKAVAFCTSEEFGLLRAVEKLMGLTVETLAGDRPERGSGAGTRPNAHRRGGKPPHGQNEKKRFTGAGGEKGKPGRGSRPARQRKRQAA